MLEGLVKKITDAFGEEAAARLLKPMSLPKRQHAARSGLPASHTAFIPCSGKYSDRSGHGCQYIFPACCMIPLKIQA